MNGKSLRPLFGEFRQEDLFNYTVENNKNLVPFFVGKV